MIQRFFVERTRTPSRKAAVRLATAYALGQYETAELVATGKLDAEYRWLDFDVHGARTPATRKLSRRMLELRR